VSSKIPYSGKLAKNTANCERLGPSRRIRKNKKTPDPAGGGNSNG